MYYLDGNRFIFSQDESLCHWGIKGMKWGVRRYQSKDGSLTPEGKKRYRSDNKQRKTLKRHVSADVKNLKLKIKATDKDQKAYEDALINYRAANSAFMFSRKKKAERIREASKNLEEAGKNLERTRSDYNLALDLYEKDAKAYTDHVNKMISEYGSEKVKALSNKTKKIRTGNLYVTEVMKTGVTVANFPVIGQIYSGLYTSGAEVKERDRRLDEASNRRY